MMDQEASIGARAEAREKWNQARRKAFWQRFSRVLGLSKQPVDLLSFEEVQKKLRLNQNTYRGLKIVPLDQIVGSMGRYHDFSRAFLPLSESDGPRWMRVAELQMETGLPPIELYEVGDAYFVKDGNHRVSVARQFGATTIEAYVWEYATPVGGVTLDTQQMDDLIAKAEYRAFLDRTRLDISHPDQEIVLTEPGMYPALELEIELYRQNLERIDGEDHTYPEAAAMWYDLVYTTAVEVIHESDALNLFPGRTEADLYVWVSRHRKELEEQYGTRVSLKDAVAQIAEGHQQRKPTAVERVMQTAARSVVDLVSSLSPGSIETQEYVLPPGPNEALGKLLAEMRAIEPEMAYHHQRGDDWRHWRGALRGKLTELIGLSYESAQEVPLEFIERNVISGVEQVKFQMTAADGLQIPGYLMSPMDRTQPLPAILVYPGHGTIRQTAGLEHSVPHKSNALALAQAGFVTITIEPRGFGELGQVDHEALDYVARLIGKTWFGTVLADGLRALDYVQSLPDVDASRLGVTGYGLGGGFALYTAALDERVRAAVIQNYLGGDIDPVAVHGHGCDFIPNLRRYAETSDVARLIAPRPVLYAYPAMLATTHAAHVWFDKMRPTYEVFRVPDRTNFVQHEKGGVFRRVMTSEWFHRWLIEEESPHNLSWAPGE